MHGFQVDGTRTITRLECLLQQGAEINCRSVVGGGLTPLHVAAKQFLPGVVRACLHTVRSHIAIVGNPETMHD